jgi:DNA-binding MarR family transcriptional regulator
MPTENVETLFALAGAYARASREAESSGLSFAELRLLAALLGSETGRRPTDLATELYVTASGITRALLPLEKRGIVERRRHSDDARSSLAALTPAGRTLTLEALQHAGERATRTLRRLSVGQAKQLQRLLDEIGR